MRLIDLIRNIPEKRIVGNPGIEIQDIAYHSAKVHEGTLFVAIRGINLDGHAFIGEALERGAKALVVEQGQEKDNGIPRVVVPDGRSALAHLSAAFFGNPSREMRVVGVTGTNGKTTTSFLIESILHCQSLPCGVIGTINYRYGGSVIPAPMTTPESYDIQKMLREMRDSGITHIVMEVSSHALDMKRVDGCHFDVGVFTNFTQDHLDYHLDLDQYRQCKEYLFTGIIPMSTKEKRTAILNVDDPTGRDLWQRLTYERMGYAIHGRTSLRARHVMNSVEGVRATIHTPQGEMKIRSPLVGEFNIYNIMAAIGTAMALGVPETSIQEGIEAVSTVPGRMERIGNDLGLEIFVDYAHTPDALERVLTVLRPLRGQSRLITVFGCGGDRDRAKRLMMGEVAATLSDLSIITSDNPRTEVPSAIIQEIEGGFTSQGGALIERETFKGGIEKTGYLKIEDRREAITLAIAAARPGDIILIAGKGHENYQILGDRRIPFDDREEVKKALQKRQVNN
jgi:UDP-N-acetylmuramoyl-L-alanyl-D-glutamate--2,6-diaminopimelate ligase